MRSVLKCLGAMVGGTMMAAAFAAMSAGPAAAQSIGDIDAKGKITVGVLTGIPPYDTVDSSGNTDGFLVDLARDVAQNLKVELELVPVNNASRRVRSVLPR